MTELSLHTSDFCFAFVHGHAWSAGMQQHKDPIPLWHAPWRANLLINSRIDCSDDGLEHYLFGLHGQTVAQTLPPVRAEQGICPCQMEIYGVVEGKTPDVQRWLQGSVAPPDSINTKLAARTAAAQQGTCGSPPSGHRGC